MWALPKPESGWVVLNSSLRKGARGIAVWALQRALGTVTADGDFGPKTDAAVRKVQTAGALTVDGIAGPQTQRALAVTVVRSHEQGLPSRLLDGFAAGEGGWLLAPLNWSKPGGVDCGLFQRRVYEPDFYTNLVIERAFDTAYQARLLGDQILTQRGVFRPRPGTLDHHGGLDPSEKAWRLAALAHNYPAGADTLSRTPVANLSSYWTHAQTWVTEIGAKFPDGTLVSTPLHWCHFYCGVLGHDVHRTNGLVTKAVVSWT